MPDMKKPIENPELVAALAALHQENTPQNQGRVLELVLHQDSDEPTAALAAAPFAPGWEEAP